MVQQLFGILPPVPFGMYTECKVNDDKRKQNNLRKVLLHENEHGVVVVVVGRGGKNQHEKNCKTGR